jgi:hypothetical protein
MVTSERILIGIAVLTLMGAAGAAAAPADEPAVRTWSAAQLEPDGQPQSWRMVDATSSGIGQSVFVYPARETPDGAATSVHASVQDFAAALDPPQILGSGYYPRSDGSLLGGVVAAWSDGDRVQVAELRPGERTFQQSFGVDGALSGFSFEEPKVAVGDDGTAAVAYLAPDSDGSGQHLSAIVRPPGSEFGSAEQISESYAPTDVNATDIAVGPDGTVVVGFAAGGRGYVAVRGPTGDWGPAEAVGDGLFGLSWFSPQVGVDAAGDVAAAWAEPDDDGGAVPVKVAFKRAGSSFAAQDTGLEMTDYGRIAMAVSAVGEMVLVAEAQTDNQYGGTRMEGITALYGNVPAGVIGKPAALTGNSGHYPSIGWNTRGDVVVTWDECCPMVLRQRRRAPLSPFGPVSDITPQIDFEGVRGGRWMLDADIDEFGNARAAWVDSGPDPVQIYVAQDGPGIFDEPASVAALGDFLAPVLPEVPAPPAPPPAVEPPPPIAAPPNPRPLRAGAPAPARLSLRITIERRLAGHARPRVMVRVACNKPCYARLAGNLRRLPLATTDVVLRSPGSKRVGLVLRGRVPPAVAASRASQQVRLAAVATDRDGQVVRLRRSARLQPTALKRG